MMGAAQDKINNSNYTYPSFPNVSKTDGNIPEYIQAYKHFLNRTDIDFVDKLTLGIYITVCIISIVGDVGNVAVIWLLGFRIKRNPFMTLILNLAVADLGVLLSTLSLGSFYISLQAWFVFYLLFQLMYSASQFLLTAISIDRCVAVFFPLWHQCKRPPHLSNHVCAVIWVLSVLLTGITGTLSIVNAFLKNIRMANYFQFMVNAVLCLPIMTITTVALLIKVCLKARQHQRGRLLTVILLTLLFFILFTFPLNIVSFFVYLTEVSMYMAFLSLPLACLNSSVNPAIYFLVGRQRKSKRRESMKVILQKVFNEEEGGGKETPV